MWTVAIDDHWRLSVCRSVCHAACCATMAESFKVLLEVESHGDPRNIVSDESRDFSWGIDAAFAKLLWPLVVLVVAILSIGQIQFL